MRQGVVCLPTGAWFDPSDTATMDSLEKHGNANVLTPDRGTSKLAQGPTAHSALVQIERFDADPPAITAYSVPTLATE